MPKSIESIEISPKNSIFKCDENLLYTNSNELILCFSKQQNIKIKDGIKSIGAVAFCTATNAQTIELPNSLTELGYMVFTNGPNLEELIIGENVKSINPMFKYLNRSGNVTISENNPNYTIKNNVLYSKDCKTLINVLFDIDGEYNVDSSVEKIGDNAFHAQWNMTKIIFPKELKEIGNSFSYCYELNEISIPINVKKIGDHCFANCNNLSKIKIEAKENSLNGAQWGATKGMRVVEWNSK